MKGYVVSLCNGTLHWHSWQKDLHNEVWVTSCPCGIPAAQCQIPASEPDECILNHLRQTFPNSADSQSSWSTRAPNVLIVDRACKLYAWLLRHGFGIYWTIITFLVDLFHLENHDIDDLVCQEYCNPRSPRNSWFMNGTKWGLGVPAMQ